MRLAVVGGLLLLCLIITPAYSAPITDGHQDLSNKTCKYINTAFHMNVGQPKVRKFSYLPIQEQEQLARVGATAARGQGNTYISETFSLTLIKFRSGKWTYWDFNAVWIYMHECLHGVTRNTNAWLPKYIRPKSNESMTELLSWQLAKRFCLIKNRVCQFTVPVRKSGYSKIVVQMISHLSYIGIIWKSSEGRKYIRNYLQTPYQYRKQLID